MKNRLFYFAIPPNVFGETAIAIKKTSMQVEGEFTIVFVEPTKLSPLHFCASDTQIFCCVAEKGWTRLIVEKPFGRDLDSFEELNKTLSEHFTEDHLYRIDHYLVRLS